MRQKINSVSKISGTIKVPGDKSISHRAIMTGSIAKGMTTIEGLLTAEDCLSTVRVFKQLGVDIERTAESSFIVQGKGLRGLQEPTDILDVGNSGTTIRLISGILAGQSFNSVLTGDSSIRKRPMGRVIEPLTLMKSRIYGRDNNRYAPIFINGSDLVGISYNSSISSAQIKSAILYAGLYAEGETKVIEPILSRDHSEKMLLQFGADINALDNKVTIKSGKELVGQSIKVPGDFSSAAFLIAAALLVPNSRLIIEGVGLNPTRIGFLEAVKAMNGNIEIISLRKYGEEQVGDLLIETSSLSGIDITEEWIPKIIDELPLLAVLATQADGTTKVTGAKELRVKETDRIATIASELRKLGIKIDELDDGFIISGRQSLAGGIVNTHGDHRIGMAMAIAGLIAKDEIIIENSNAINISYPNFFEDLTKISKY